MNKVVAVLLGILTLTSCSKSTRAPKNLLSQDQIIAIWTDILLAEGVIDEMRYQDQDTAKADYQILEKGIFEKHGIDSIQYRASIDYYSQNVKDLDSLHQIIVDTLSYRENFLKTIEQEKQAKAKSKKSSTPVPSSQEAKKQKIEIPMDTTVIDPRLKRLRNAARYLDIEIEKYLSDKGK